MLSVPRLMTTLMLAGGILLLYGKAAPAQARVDLALVLAVDVSFSMEPDEQDLQRRGFVQAFQSPDVHRAIRQGVQGRIAVVYVEWSGAFDQQIIVPWTVIEQPGDGQAFAERLLLGPIQRMGYTSISGVIDFSVRQLRQSRVQADRQVIDISGDGPNNTGRPGHPGPRRGSGPRHHHQWPADHAEAARWHLGYRGSRRLLPRLCHRWPRSLSGVGSGESRTSSTPSRPRSSGRSRVGRNLARSSNMPRPTPRRTVWLANCGDTNRQPGD